MVSPCIQSTAYHRSDSKLLKQVTIYKKYGSPVTKNVTLSFISREHTKEGNNNMHT